MTKSDNEGGLPRITADAFRDALKVAIRATTAKIVWSSDGGGERSSTVISVCSHEPQIVQNICVNHRRNEFSTACMIIDRQSTSGNWMMMFHYSQTTETVGLDARDLPLLWCDRNLHYIIKQTEGVSFSLVLLSLLLLL